MSFDRKNTSLESIHFVLEEINSVGMKLVVCSISGRKFYFWKEFILLRDIISVDKNLMCSDPERISVDRFVIQERIYSLWKELNSVRN